MERERGAEEVGVVDQASQLRERNRKHAKKTRLRKKAMLEGMKDRLLELQNENTKLKHMFEDKSTANILVGLSDGSDKTSGELFARRSVPMGKLDAALSSGNILDDIQNNVRLEAASWQKTMINTPAASGRTVATSSSGSDSSGRASREPTSASGEEAVDTGAPLQRGRRKRTNSALSRQSSPSGSGQGDTSEHGNRGSSAKGGKETVDDGGGGAGDLAAASVVAAVNEVHGSSSARPPPLAHAAGDHAQYLAELRKERSRVHAKLTRDRKRLFASRVKEMIAYLERQNATIKQHLNSLASGGDQSEEAPGAAGAAAAAGVSSFAGRASNKGRSGVIPLSVGEATSGGEPFARAGNVPPAGGNEWWRVPPLLAAGKKSKRAEGRGGSSSPEQSRDGSRDGSTGSESVPPSGSDTGSGASGITDSSGASKTAAAATAAAVSSSSAATFSADAHVGASLTAVVPTTAAAAAAKAAANAASAAATTLATAHSKAAVAAGSEKSASGAKSAPSKDSSLSSSRNLSGPAPTARSQNRRSKTQKRGTSSNGTTSNTASSSSNNSSSRSSNDSGSTPDGSSPEWEGGRMIRITSTEDCALQALSSLQAKALAEAALTHYP